MKNKYSIFVVCGETSSDEHTGPVINAIRRRLGDVSFFGMGGAELEKEGMELVIDARTTASVMGFTEVLGKLGQLYKAFWKLLEEVDLRKPDLAILVDFPDFNLRMAEKLKSRGIKVVYFISPQLWAWRKNRISKIKTLIDKIIPILPFEEDFYKGYGVNAKYVGHPFKDKALPTAHLQDFLEQIGAPLQNRIVAMLPGSRRAEVQKILPVLADTAKILREAFPNFSFIVPVAPSVSHVVEEMKSDLESLDFIEGQARELLSISDAAIVASGTATVEAALTKTPFCICYKVSGLTYFIGKLLIRGVKFIGMPNLIAGREIVREFIQNDCNGRVLAEEVKKLLQDDTYRRRIKSDLEEVDSLLQTKQASMSSNIEQLTVAETIAMEIMDVLPEYDRRQKVAI